MNELSNGSGRWRLSDLSVSDRDIAISRFASDATIDKQMDVQTILLEPPLFRCYKWDERVSLLLISIQCDIDRLIDFCSQCARKWKDATKLLPIKLGLLHTALEVCKFIFPISATGKKTAHDFVMICFMYRGTSCLIIPCPSFTP